MDFLETLEKFRRNFYREYLTQGILDRRRIELIFGNRLNQIIDNFLLEPGISSRDKIRILGEAIKMYEDPNLVDEFPLPGSPLMYRGRIINKLERAEKNLREGKVPSERDSHLFLGRPECTCRLGSERDQNSYAYRILQYVELPEDQRRAFALLIQSLYLDYQDPEEAKEMAVAILDEVTENASNDVISYVEELVNEFIESTSNEEAYLTAVQEAIAADLKRCRCNILAQVT